MVAKSSYKTPSFAVDKTLASIYLDPSHPASFGGLDAVYQAVNRKGRVQFLGNKSRIGRVNKTFTCFTNLPVDITREVESLYLA